MFEFHPVARFRSPFTSKFGLPKQSSLVAELKGDIILEPPYRSADFIRGIDGFDYLWIIWIFSANRHAASGALVRPPLLGGNARVGVFASRSPYRPNPIGLSAVRLEKVVWEDSEAPVLHVSGADLMDGTPILDIKPYLPYADSHPDVRAGFTDSHAIKRLTVVFSPEAAARLSEEERQLLMHLLELDPRPHYQHDADRIYGMAYGGRDIRFRVADGQVTVTEIV